MKNPEMKSNVSIPDLLRWRFEQAQAAAPPPPQMSRLLERSRPWWATWPDQFQALVEHLRGLKAEYGHAMAEARPFPGSHPVPSLIVLKEKVNELEAFARILHFNIRGNRFRLRFQLESSLATPPEHLEVNFIGENAPEPLLSAPAVLSVNHEYSMDVELPEQLTTAWGSLKVTDRMPFRFILRSNTDVNG